MAPALDDTIRDPEVLDDVAFSSDTVQTHRRRALASVDNLDIPMDEDDMGLTKDSQDMEQILVDLGNSDLVQADLLQAIKTLEAGGDSLSTGETDAIFPLSGFDLAEAIDSEGDATDDKIKFMQSKLERRCAFLQRRLRILQARALGKRISEEAAQTFEKCLRGSRKEGAGRTVGLKAFLKKVETTSTLQASAASRTVVGPKYYNAGSSKGDASKSASIGVPSGTLAGLEDTAGALRSHLSIIKHELDSDATLSSSGAESNDEAVTYNNPHQQPMPIEKRALWTWQRTRASIAARWGWLQAQIQELEYKVRQHTDLQKQVRQAKGAVQFEGEPAAYVGPLPGSDLPDDEPALETCARIRPLRRDTFKKRKLLQMHNLHTATAKAAKPSDVRCECQPPLESCPVCTGRSVCTLPIPPFSTLCGMQRRAIADPCYHPQLSDIRDVPAAVHLSALTSRAWFRSRSVRAPPPRPRPAVKHAHPLPLPPVVRSKRGRPPLSRKVRERERSSETPKEEDRNSTSTVTHTVTNESTSRPVPVPVPGRGRGRPSVESRHTRVSSSYDIDNIVIPTHVAANTRPQILHYKEIITPQWRVMEMPSPRNNGIIRSKSRMSSSEDEDISDAAVLARHIRSETHERCKYIRKQKRRSQHNSSEEPPPPPLPPPPPVLVRTEIIEPYSPREFPLTDDDYHGMLAAMPDGYQPLTPRRRDNDDNDNADDYSLSSPNSPLMFDGDDPDDVEWDPGREKGERRKSAYR